MGTALERELGYFTRRATSGYRCPPPTTSLGTSPSPSAGSRQARSWGRALHPTYLSGGTAVHQYLFKTPRKPG